MSRAKLSAVAVRWAYSEWRDHHTPVTELARALGVNSHTLQYAFLDRGWAHTRDRLSGIVVPDYVLEAQKELESE